MKNFITKIVLTIIYCHNCENNYVCFYLYLILSFRCTCVRSQDQFARMERFRVARRGIALDPAQAQLPPEQLGIEPLALPL